MSTVHDMDNLPGQDYRARAERLRQASGIDADTAYLVTDLVNIRYLSGFSGSAGLLLVQAEEVLLLTDYRYAEIAEAALDGTGVGLRPCTRVQQLDVLGELLRSVAELHIEAAHLTVEMFDRLSDALTGTSLVRSSRVLEHLRLVKDTSEIARLQRAADIAAEAYATLPDHLEKGVTERELARHLEQTMVELGADAVGFPSIVAAGRHASSPHARPTDDRIKPGEPVVIDFGANIDGYHSDITRTIWYGELASEYRAIYRAAMTANELGRQAAVAGTTHAQVDRVCRSYLREIGYPDSPLHPTGHNLGLNVHELPYLAEGSDEPLRPGQVITIEPGVYERGIGGARLEDMVLIQDGECRVLSELPYMQVV